MRLRYLNSTREGDAGKITGQSTSLSKVMRNALMHIKPSESGSRVGKEQRRERNMVKQECGQV